MKTIYIKLSLILVFGLLSACSDENILAIPYIEQTTAITPPESTYTSGTADFSNYVAVGSSMTAGYADGALYQMGQDDSFPNILSQQFAMAGGESFTQPLVDDNLGGLLLQGNQIADNRFVFDPINQRPVTISGTPTTEVTNIKPGPYNNMGVTGAKSYHVLANGYGNIAGVPSGQANPYFARMASSPNVSILEDAVAKGPTFFTLWLGANDVLGYAVAGGDGVDHNSTGNTDPSTYGGDDITNANTFAQVYGGVVQTLVQGSSGQGILVNIPNVADTPYFTTVPYNPIPLDAATAGAVNNAYSDYNNGLLLAEAGTLISSEERAARTINFQASTTNAVVIVDEYLTDLSALGLPPYRQTTAEDLMVLTSSRIIGTLADPNNPLSVNGVGVPLADKWVLVTEEQREIADATTAFNATIKTVADQFDLLLFDANALLNEVSTNGLQVGSATITGDFATGGAFSLDGVHPTPRGHAIIANAMIDLINAKYEATIPKVNPIEYTGIYLQ